MDTPNLPLPLDAREQPILNSLQRIRDELTLLKQDRSSYVKSSDILPLYERTIAQVQLLNEIRADKSDEDNQLDRVLDGCFQLLSLFFMTIGRNNEAPAAYALTSTIKRALDHLSEVGLYSAKDLVHCESTLRRLREILTQDNSTHSAKLLTLLSNRIEVCQSIITTLLTRLARLEGNLADTHEKLISILRSISQENTRSKFSSSEIHRLQKELKEIDAHRVNGDFVDADGHKLGGSDEVVDLLQRITKWSEMVIERKGDFPEEFVVLYQKLVGIRNQLEKLTLTQAWSLRETDLYDYQRQLDKIDESRVDGNFNDSQGRPAELYVQRTLLYLIRRSYGYIYYLMVSSEPVSEALLPVYNQLQTLKRCLIEVKNSGGVSSPRELYPYSMKLNSIDNMRVDGKFMHGKDIPEGQGSVNDLLAECFELNYELRVAAEAEGED